MIEDAAPRTGLTWPIGPWERIRWIFLGGAAAVISGVLVLGVGGRLVMLASRFLHPDSIGLLTEGGNRIGDFTAEGTLALLIFGGLLSGISGGIVWVLIKTWLPRRASVVAVSAIALGAFFLVESDNRDFTILRDPGIDLVMLLGLVGAFGVAVFHIDAWLDRQLPAADRPWRRGLYTALVALVTPASIPTMMSYFSEEFCFCGHPPVWAGVGLIVAGAASLTWWLLASSDRDSVPRWLTGTGLVATVWAVVAGGIYLAIDLARIF